MWTLPAAIEDALWAAAPRVPRSALVAAIRARSIAYTRERERIAGLGGAADLAARAVFFAVADAAKVRIPLAELRGRGLVPARRPLRVLDVGAGTGAMTFGAFAELGAPLDVVAVDRDAEALEVMRAAFERVCDGDIALVPRDADEPRWGDEPFDLVVAGAVFNEVLPERRYELARNLLESVADDGAVVIVEPALRQTARDLHRLRDAVVDAGAAHVFAPCIRSVAPCPMLADDRDWCHEDRPVQLPPRAAQLAAATGLRERGLKFSYLTLRKRTDPLVPASAGTLLLRVVSQLNRPKGKLEVDGCGDAGRVRLRLLRRHRSESNRDIASVRRGDVVALAEPIAPAARTGVIDIRADTPVRRLQPASRRDAP
ncbi:MAG: methyltransferase domain-containing protein [Deltaproteobacteria bacterium]|nr:MAG: methyltransferase domain-containing protein [Deltaproteobacteria bacterium]